MKTFQSNFAENFSWRDMVNARLPGKMAGASPKLLVLLHTGIKHPNPFVHGELRAAGEREGCARSAGTGVACCL